MDLSPVIDLNLIDYYTRMLFLPIDGCGLSWFIPDSGDYPPIRDWSAIAVIMVIHHQRL